MTDKNQKEIKRFPFEMKSFAEDGEFFTFEGYASTFGNVDLGDDVIVAGAFKNSIQENPAVPVLWQHQMCEPIGISIQLSEDSKGLFIQGKLPRADSHVAGRVIPQMKVGSIREMSIGFFTRDSEMKDGIRYIKEIELFEVSLVTKAMNPQALVGSFKSFESLSDIEKSLKEMGLSNTEAKTLISKIKEFSIQRDVEEKQALREAEGKKKALELMRELTDFIKSNKK